MAEKFVTEDIAIGTSGNVQQIEPATSPGKLFSEDVGGVRTVGYTSGLKTTMENMPPPGKQYVEGEGLIQTVGYTPGLKTTEENLPSSGEPYVGEAGLVRSVGNLSKVPETQERPMSTGSISRTIQRPLTESGKLSSDTSLKSRNAGSTVPVESEKLVHKVASSANLDQIPSYQPFIEAGRVKVDEQESQPSGVPSLAQLQSVSRSVSNGQCKSLKDIGAETGLSQAVIRQCLTFLESQGLVKTGTSDRYCGVVVLNKLQEQIKCCRNCFGES